MGNAQDTSNLPPGRVKPGASPQDRNDARIATSGALAAALVWVAAMGTYALTGPGMSSEFSSHLLVGLGMFCVIIVGPLLLAVVTLNWIVRRIAGGIITLTFFGMTREGLSQGFGWLADAGIVVVCAFLVGVMLFFLSRPAVMTAVGDFYNFLSVRDVVSRYFVRRKPETI
jgi:hypothetical protein